MKSIIIILLAAGFFGSCGKNFTSGLSFGSKTTSVLLPEKKVSLHLPESNSVKPGKEYPPPGFSPMSLPGRF